MAIYVCVYAWKIVNVLCCSTEQVSLIKPKIVRSASPLASNLYQFLLLQFTDAHFGAVCVPTIQGNNQNLNLTMATYLCDGKNNVEELS